VIQKTEKVFFLKKKKEKGKRKEITQLTQYFCSS
jgi:hypothetical protein